MFNLRPAARADASAIRTLVIKAHINPGGLKWPRFVVAETLSGEMIACGQIKPRLDGSDELASIVVTPQWRGKGVARAIIQYLIASHPGDLYLMCRSGLAPLYEKFGFRAIGLGEMPRYFQRVKRLSKLVEFWMPDGEYLLVMKREADK